MTALPRRIVFFGHVYPMGLKLNIKAPDVTFTEGAGKFTASFGITVVNSAIGVQCNFDNTLPDHPYSLWAQSQEITQTLVNLVAFQLGAGAITVLNEWINENGKRNTLAFVDPALPPLCTAFSQNSGYDKIIGLVFAEPELFMALNDIVLANAMPRHVIINCARCVEAIRELMSDAGSDRNAAWAKMRDHLNIDRPYIEFITTNSQKPRHGKQSELNDAAILEVRARAWKIMDRFLHYRLGNNKLLEPASFPLLAG